MDCVFLREFGSKLGCHSVIPVPGATMVAVNSEAIEESGQEPYDYCFLVDVSEPSSLWVVGSIPQPEPAQLTGLRSYFEKGGPFYSDIHIIPEVT